MKYELKDWTGEIILKSATLEEMANYFNLDVNEIKDEVDLEEAIKAQYDGMSAPTFTKL